MSWKTPSLSESVFYMSVDPLSMSLVVVFEPNMRGWLMLTESNRMFLKSNDFHRSMVFLLKLTPEIRVSFANQNFSDWNSRAECWRVSVAAQWRFSGSTMEVVEVEVHFNNIWFYFEICVCVFVYACVYALMRVPGCGYVHLCTCAYRGLKRC